MVVRSYLHADVFAVHFDDLDPGMVQDTVFLFLACRNLCMGHGNACGHQCFLCGHQAQAEDQRYLLHNMLYQVLHLDIGNAPVLFYGLEHVLGRSALSGNNHVVKLCLRTLRNLRKGIKDFGKGLYGQLRF